jgi:CcmD family protein
MEFLFRLANQYGTLWVTLLIWVGLFLYLLRLDRRIGELEVEQGEAPGTEEAIRSR